MKTFLRKALLVFILTTLPSAIWAYDAYINRIYYKLDTKNKTASVTYGHYKNSYSGNVIIPEEIVCSSIKYSVTSIGEYAFYDSHGLTSIVIPNSVTRIEDSAFQSCTGLTSITIPNSVTSIGNSAFWRCTGLTSITIPNSVTSIEFSAFSGCTGLTNITIPNSVTSIGHNAFYDCTGVTSIIVEKENSKYDSRYNCNAIIETATNKIICGCKNTIIPSSVTSIGIHAFSGCTDLTNITIPNSVTSICDNAFSNCI